MIRYLGFARVLQEAFRGALAILTYPHPLSMDDQQRQVGACRALLASHAFVGLTRGVVERVVARQEAEAAAKANATANEPTANEPNR